MFSQLAFVRLRAAEAALRNGRLDDAYRIVSSPDLESHKKSASIKLPLGGKLLERARDHFRADRFTEALHDLDKVAQCGGHDADAAELRRNVGAVMSEELRKDGSHRRRMDEAVRRVNAGSLGAGERFLAGADPSDPTTGHVRRLMAEHLGAVESLIAQVSATFDRGQVYAAIDRLRQAKAISPHHCEVTKWEAELCRELYSRSMAAFREGRLPRCADDLAGMRGLEGHDSQRRDLEQAMVHARVAATSIEAGRFADARRHVQALELLGTGASWIRIAMEHLEGLEEHHTNLCSGPLGRRLEPAPEALRAEPRGLLDQTVALARSPVVHGPHPTRLHLFIDGGGSYLILRGSRFSIGRVAAQNPADMAFFSDLAEHHAEITRVEDDYFLSSSKKFDIAGKGVHHHLLQSGERVVLGRKGKFTFRLPSKQSQTAVLELSDTTKMPHDVRRVILFDQHATIGVQETAHLRCPLASAPIVLFSRADDLLVRMKSNGRNDGQSLALRLGESIDMGGIRMVLQPWKLPGLV